MKPSVLIVDDEQDLLDLLAHHLAGAGFQVLLAARGAEGIALAGRQRPDAIVLDVMLPDLLGTEVLKRLRRDPATSAIPVLLLTARGEETDRVVGFELGADDYVVKPFSPRELVLRIRSLLRRAAPVDEEAAVVLVRGGIRIDPQRHEAAVDEQPIDLTPLEFRLLSYLMSRPGRVLNREQLLERVWGEGVFVTERTVDTHVKRLRAKLRGRAERIETVRGVGYRFRE
jgi:two-component system phosphate regulon response regulator PhoB